MAAPHLLTHHEAEARRRLPTEVWDWLARGAGEGSTLADNRAAWERIRLPPRVLRGIHAVDTSIQALGQTLALPVITAPTGRATRFHPEGEAELLRGVAAAGGLVVLPSSVAASIEALARAAPATPRWLQLYMDADRGWMAETVQQARAAGCSAIVLTVDLAPEAGDAASPPSPKPAAWEAPADRRPRPCCPASSLDDLAWLCGLGMAVVVKGVLRADDAAACVDAGASAVVVSNHGGNQLDGVVATADALEPVVLAVAGRAQVFVDGGLRDGASVLKALALGARGVMVGRPASCALAAGGAVAVTEMLTWFQADLARAMALCGAATVADIDRSLAG